MRAALPCLLLVALGTARGEKAEDFRSPAPGPIGMVRPFEGTFRFGWSNVPAAEAHARLTRENGMVSVRVDGGTRGLARALWQLDVKHGCSFREEGIVPRSFVQSEIYADKRIVTRTEFFPGGAGRLRVRTPNGGPSKWKEIGIPGIRDIVSAMFLIRSQRLEPGDKVALPAFPGDSPFWVEADVVRRETVAAGGKRWPSLRLDFRLRRIEKETGGDYALKPHGKFRSGTVWISDDADRIPLRAEVQVFIGFVYGELSEIRFSAP